jgi:serine/threonine protein kinase
LEEVPQEHRKALFAELAVLDVHHAFRTHHSVSLADYVRDFPEYIDASCRAELEAAIEQGLRTVAHGKPPPPRSGEAPATIGKYQILNLLGSGGQADAFLAFHPTLAQVAVLKLARDAGKLNEEFRDQILREGRVLAGLRHPNLVRVFDLDFDGNRPFLVVEFISGRTLEAFLKSDRPD